MEFNRNEIIQLIGLGNKLMLGNDEWIHLLSVSYSSHSYRNRKIRGWIVYLIFLKFYTCSNEYICLNVTINVIKSLLIFLTWQKIIVVRSYLFILLVLFILHRTPYLNVHLRGVPRGTSPQAHLLLLPSILLW